MRRLGYAVVGVLGDGVLQRGPVHVLQDQHALKRTQEALEAGGDRTYRGGRLGAFGIQAPWRQEMRLGREMGDIFLLRDIILLLVCFLCLCPARRPSHAPATSLGPGESRIRPSLSSNGVPTPWQEEPWWVGLEVVVVDVVVDDRSMPGRFKIQSLFVHRREE